LPVVAVVLLHKAKVVVVGVLAAIGQTQVLRFLLL
jgi:hypothetical protein